ncbi:MAG: lipoate protein ligase C-terminal domain-containing protein [Patescibacteria group bacterium]
MEKNITYKAPQGKLLRIKADIEDSVIQEITITGDFFIHPEEDLFKIEEILSGIKTSQAEEVLRDFLRKNKTEIVGFSPDDLGAALNKKNL